MRAIITVGAPGSGKSTWASEFMQERGETHGEQWQESNRDWIRFNRVQPGGNWGTWNWKREAEVTNIQNAEIAMCAQYGYNLIVSDTNTDIERRNALSARLQALGYEVEYKAFMDTPFETMVKRDAVRYNGVGSFVIYQHHIKVLEQFREKRYTPDPSKRNAIILDIDGTIAKMHNRGPFEWSKVGNDLARLEVMIMAEALAVAADAVIIVTSGRDASCREETQAWLNRHGVWSAELLMRPAGDMRKDTIIKEEIFWRDIEPNYNVIAAFDDRPCVVRLWHEIGVPNVFAVANPFIEF